MSDRFAMPRWTDPLDVEATIAAVPEDATVKGMFFHAPMQHAERVSGKPVTEKRYVGFKDYTVREHMRVLADCAKAAFPNETTREGLRRLGHDAYETFIASMVGKVVMSVAARQWEGAIRLVGRAYSVVGNKSSATVESIGERETQVRISGVWNFPDSYHIGVLEAAMRDYQKRGSVHFRAHSAETYTYKLTWSA